jgi:glycosyltransferase involved in cell wall biosynthesis
VPPLVSIVVPCYNGERYLPGLAQSLAPVVADGRGDCEVIFVDDGSTDRSAELARKYLSGARFVRQQNRGLSAARNAGVAEARGEYLQLLDVDDTIEPEKLEVQAAAADKAGADVVYSDWRLLTLDNGAVRSEVFAPAQAPCEMVEALFIGWYVPPVGYLFRRSTYVALGGCDESIKVWEDFDLFLRLAMAGTRHVYAPGVLSNYYRYLDVRSLARRDPQGSALSRERVLLKTLETLARANALTPPRRKAAARALFGVLRTAGIGDPSWLRAIAAKIRELDPAFKPHGPAPYRAAASTLGIVKAERLAVQLRLLRNRLCPKSNRTP